RSLFFSRHCCNVGREKHRQRLKITKYNKRDNVSFKEIVWEWTLSTPAGAPRLYKKICCEI
ncbi:MAG: hypothetical protein ACE10J_04295, partial [Thermodesulfobacteriota bacterium]